jgi:hypothetical protein
MRFALWIVTILASLAGLGVLADGGFPQWPHPIAILGWGLIALGALTCPVLWSGKAPIAGPFALRGKTRLMLVLAMLLATPLMLPVI